MKSSMPIEVPIQHFCWRRKGSSIAGTTCCQNIRLAVDQTSISAMPERDRRHRSCSISSGTRPCHSSPKKAGIMTQSPFSTMAGQRHFSTLMAPSGAMKPLIEASSG